MTDLFTDADLSGYLQTPVGYEAAVTVERVVWGWLQPALGLVDRPDPVSDQVFAWAIELAAIAYTNPAGASSQEAGPFRDQYSPERRAAILNEAAGAAPAGAPAPPLGYFPEAVDWPDPARLY